MPIDHVLITGGTGFIGAHVAAAFVNEQATVTVYDRNTTTETLSTLGVADEVTVRQGDVTDPRDVAAAVEASGATHVVHLAAVLSETAATDPRTATEVNVTGTTNVLKAVRAAGDRINRLTITSSAGVYAPPDRYATDGEWWVDETALVDPATLYEATKYYCEQQARAYREQYDLPVVSLRPTLVYGPGWENGNSAGFDELIRGPARGEPVSVYYGSARLAWLYAPDMARAFRSATFADSEALSRTVYNVRGPLATVREVATIGRELLPDVAIDINDTESIPWTQRLDTTRIETDLGFRPEYDIKAGVRNYINEVRRASGDPQV
jgi:nucleoside-diphosphate-sugar epimerase